MIVGITGHKGSGKDTVACIWRYIYNLNKRGFSYDYIISGVDYLPFINNSDKNSDPFRIVHFADPLREVVSIITGVSPEELQNPLTKDSEILPDFKICEREVTARETLQYIGTDLFRNQVDKNVWVNALFHRIDPFNKDYIIPDVRFSNEIDAIRKYEDSIIIKMERISSFEDKHISETALDDYNTFDYIIHNNGSFADLIVQVYDTMKKSNVI